MIITKTPYRISFFGGGTDHPEWYLQNGGLVLSTTIDKYCYISCRRLPPFFEHKHRIVYSNIENVNDVCSIKHPSVKGILKYLNIDYGLEIHHDGDLPARSGIGSSSAFTVGLINAIYSLQNMSLSKKELSELAIHIEKNVINESVGCQDQCATAYGGLNKILFSKNGTISVDPIAINADRIKQLEEHLLLFYTGISRNSSEIEKIKISKIEINHSLLSEVKNITQDAISILTGKESIDKFGILLDESWKLKKCLSNGVSNKVIDSLYETAKNFGAIGGKILGSGGGGFFLIFAEPSKHDLIKIKLKNFLHVPLKFENSGSRVIFENP